MIVPCYETQYTDGLELDGPTPQMQVPSTLESFVKEAASSPSGSATVVVGFSLDVLKLSARKLPERT